MWEHINAKVNNNSHRVPNVDCKKVAMPDTNNVELTTSPVATLSSMIQRLAATIRDIAMISPTIVR